MTDRADDVEQAILTLLDGCGAERMVHAEARSAPEAAAARGTPLQRGAKSLFMKLDRMGWAVLALPGDQQLDGGLLRRGLGVARYRLARPDELEAVIGLPPGAVPPFGAPIFPCALLVDATLAAEPWVAFALARRSCSLRVDTAAWLGRAQPSAVLPLGRPASGG
ncbi:MAG: YbaK/EbsC family protein [Deltaproteobacteria bacterium]|nr:YbaK/EbsC family protein [Deltaproteobacteria bacterium]